VDDAQTVLQRMSYDAWGRRRNPDGTDDSWTTLGSLNNTQDHTGYTGHEQFDVLGLVHMNGRIYDPISAKFTSADPHVTDASDGQNYNRYSYVLNNPLAYTDPTGYFQETFQDHYQETGIPQGFGVSSFSAITLEQVIVWGSCSLNPVCVARNSALRASTALERITLAAAFRAMTGSFGTGLGIYGAFAASGVYAMGEHAKWEQSLHKGSYYVPSLADPFAFEHAILNAGADQGQDEEAVGASGEKTETEGGAATDSGEEAAKPKTGKNDTHIDQGAKQRAKEKLAEVKEELEKLKSTPNKTPAIKEQIAKLEKQVKHLQSKADAVGENHSMKPKR